MVMYMYDSICMAIKKRFGKFLPKTDMASLLNPLSGYILSQFKYVLGSFAELVKSAHPSLYSYILGQSILTSPAVYAVGGLPLVYNIILPVVGGIVYRMFEDMGGSVVLGPISKLIPNPLKIISKL